MPYIHSLQKNTKKGYLYVPVFGGGTSDTEYEVLTGNSKQFLPNGGIAYQLYWVKMNTALPIRWSRKGTLPQRCIPARRRPGTGQAFIHGWTLNNLSIWKTGEEDRNITDIMQAILLHIGKYEICTEVKKWKTSLSFAWRSRIMAVIVILPELKILPRT